MQTGTIRNIVPTQEGGYQSDNGWINTFDMTIQCQDGTFTAQIGSKSTPYPIAVGQQITVEMSNSQYGPRFKKVNPQYQQQGGQPQRPQGQAQRPQGGRKADDPVQLYIIRQSSIKAAVDFLGDGEYEPKDVLDVAEKFVQYVLNGPTRAGFTQNQQQQYNNANPDYVGNDPAPPEEDDTIPF